MLLKGSEHSVATQITVPHITIWKSDRLRRYGWDVTDHPPYSPDLTSHRYPSPRTPSEARPASNLQQTPTSSKLPPPSTIYSIPIPSTAGYNAWCHVVTNAKCQWRLRGGLVCNTCNPSAPYASPYESRSTNQSVCYLTF